MGKFFKLRKEHVPESRVEHGSFKGPETITVRGHSSHLFRKPSMSLIY